MSARFLPAHAQVLAVIGFATTAHTFDTSRALPGVIYDHVVAVILMYVLGIIVIGIPVILAYILVCGVNYSITVNK